METITEQLTSLAKTITAIKDAIVAKGVAVADTDPFSAYASKIGEISGGGEPVEKTKFGVDIDNFIGDVDADGQLSAPVSVEEVNLAGVKSIAYYGLQYAFAGSNINRFIADDIETSGVGGLYRALYASSVKHASFDNIVEINESNAFADCFYGCTYLSHLSYKKLKKITGLGIFQNALSNTLSLKMTEDEIFPSLEEVSGGNVLSTGRYKANYIVTFSKVKKITGDASKTYSIFGGIYAKNTVWNFPSATEFTGFIWNISSSYPGEIHFAAANQAAIEACEGYDYKWGFAGATIYFDL